jgi:hypothetical protein
MSGELKIVNADGGTSWFGRDERFPEEVRSYTGDPRHWQYQPLDRVRQVVDDSLKNGAEIEQGDPVRFFQTGASDSVGEERRAGPGSGYNPGEVGGIAVEEPAWRTICSGCSGISSSAIPDARKPKRSSAGPTRSKTAATSRHRGGGCCVRWSSAPIP